jgi:hypothetical protein
MTPLIKINVGGTLFETRRQWFENLEDETPLRLMVLGPAETDAEVGEGSAESVPFLDRDADTFKDILRWMRDRRVEFNTEERYAEILEEAR